MVRGSVVCVAEGNLVVGREILQLTETVVAEQEQRVGGGENLGGRVTLGKEEGRSSV